MEATAVRCCGGHEPHGFRGINVHQNENRVPLSRSQRVAVGRPHRPGPRRPVSRRRHRRRRARLFGQLRQLPWRDRRGRRRHRPAARAAAACGNRRGAGSTRGGRHPGHRYAVLPIDPGRDARVGRLRAQRARRRRECATRAARQRGARADNLRGTVPRLPPCRDHRQLGRPRPHRHRRGPHARRDPAVARRSHWRHAADQPSGAGRDRGWHHHHGPAAQRRHLHRATGDDRWPARLTGQARAPGLVGEPDFADAVVQRRIERRRPG